MIYKFLQEKHKELEDSFAKEGKNFNDLTSEDIIKKALTQKDPLCLKVVEKFTEIFAVESANLSLKTLPLSGLYLIGGVTNGIREYIIQTNTFLDNFYKKGRMEPIMRQVPIYLVNPDVEVGLLGAEEMAYRLNAK